MAAMNLLSTKGLSRHFGGLQAVDQVSLDLPEGEIRALIGPNGAGKTTLVSLICGRIKPHSGSITFDGQDITRLPAHKRVGLGIAYTFQITSVFANLNARENVALAAQSRMQRNGGLTIDGAAHARLVNEALERVGLADHANTQAGNLAYGHQRLLEVAMGLALGPRLLILDEPTQGLSDGEVAAFCELVRDIGGQTTVLLIEHNMDVVMTLAHSITVLANGAILAEGTPEQIKADPAVLQAYLGA